MKFLSEIKKRNILLYLFGLFCWIGSIVCMFQIFRSNTQVMGVNAWIKPLKFFISVAIFAWTMAWYLFYLKKQFRVKVYSWMVILVMSFELFVVVWQAANGRLSHFNISSPLYLSLYQWMGVAIVMLTVWTLVMGIFFFTEKGLNIPITYNWGIRLGIIVFVIFSFEGGIMASRLAHTVGHADGGNGIPLLNWSKEYGDLRIAHFMGIHALQIIPLVSYYFCNKTWKVFFFTALYIALTAALLWQALKGVPLVAG